MEPREITETGEGSAHRSGIAPETIGAFLELAPDAIVIIDIQGRIVLVNAQTETMFGHPRETMIGRGVEMLIPERFRGSHPKDRGRFFAEPRTRPMGEDRVRLAAIIDSSEDAIYSKDPLGIITSWNPAAERLFGYRTSEIIGELVSVLIPPNRAVQERTILAQLIAGEKIDHYETERLRKDGSIVEVALAVSPIHDLAGSIVGGSVIARDISEKKRADEALHKSERSSARSSSRRPTRWSSSIAMGGSSSPTLKPRISSGTRG